METGGFMKLLITLLITGVSISWANFEAPNKKTKGCFNEIKKICGEKPKGKAKKEWRACKKNNISKLSEKCRNKISKRMKKMKARKEMF